MSNEETWMAISPCSLPMSGVYERVQTIVNCRVHSVEFVCQDGWIVRILARLTGSHGLVGLHLSTHHLSRFWQWQDSMVS